MPLLLLSQPLSPYLSFPTTPSRLIGVLRVLPVLYVLPAVPVLDACHGLQDYEGTFKQETYIIKSFIVLFYFSTATMTGAGFGDIYPTAW